ncbi:MAG TPA: MFS transporter [Stellaceae bacterium]|nr:MFS transporter [Stellaceae bacterium]
MAATDITADVAVATATADEISTRIDALPFLPSHWRIASILGAGTLFDAFDSLSIGAAMTMIVATFSLDYKTGGALISSAFVGQFFGAIAFGYIGERIGRKWAFVSALTIFGLCSLGAALAQSVNEIMAARIIQGVGLGAEVPVAAALFTEFVRGSARGLFIMVYETIFVWGIFLAPVVSLACLTFFGPALGWRVVFAVGALPLIGALIAALKLPESPRWLAAKGRLPEAQAVVEAMENEAKRRGKKLLPAARVTVKAERTRFLELFRGIYAKRTFVVWTMWFCSYFVSNGFNSWAPTLYVKIGGLSTAGALKISILSGFIQLITCYFVAVSVDKHGRRPWFAGAFALAAIGAIMGVIATAVLGLHGWLALAVCGIVMITGSGTNGLGVYLYTPELYPTRMRAWATATASSLNRLGSALAPVIVGALLAAGVNMAIVFAMFALVATFAACVVWFVGEETKRRVLEELSP